jgi:gamma-glutamylcyclotransferase
VARISYFAYGSNMQRATFVGRRGIAPATAEPARAAGWRLVLDKPPLIPSSHGFANLVADRDGEVFGVLYALSDEDMAHVELTEGVALGNYRRVEIEVVRLAAALRPTRALTLISDERDPQLRPSTLYLARLIAGAEEHGLPAEWIARLRAIPTAPDSPAAAAARRIIDEALARLKR